MNLDPESVLILVIYLEVPTNRDNQLIANLEVLTYNKSQQIRIDPGLLTCLASLLKLEVLICKSQEIKIDVVGKTYKVLTCKSQQTTTQD